MTTIVTCPACRRALHLPEEHFGRTVQCPDCKHAFVAQPPAAVQVTALPPPAREPPPVAPARRPSADLRDEPDDDLDDLDDLRVGSRRGGRDGRAPDRGGVVLALGIISLALSFFSFFLYILPIWVVPFGVGLVGWVMGYRDLRAMRDGRMDPTNQVMTLVGLVLSIAGFVISACVALFNCGILGFFGIMICGLAMNPPPPPPGAPRR